MKGEKFTYASFGLHVSVYSFEKGMPPTRGLTPGAPSLTMQRRSLIFHQEEN